MSDPVTDAAQALHPDGTVRLPDAIESWLDGHFETEKDDDPDEGAEWRNVTAVAIWSLIYRRGDEETDSAAIDALRAALAAASPPAPADPTAVLESIADSFESPPRFDGDALRLILDEEGPEAVVEAVAAALAATSPDDEIRRLQATITAWGVRWQEQFDRAEKADQRYQTALYVIRRLIDGWSFDDLDLEPEDGGPTWFRGVSLDGYEHDQEDEMSDAERAVLTDADRTASNPAENASESDWPGFVAAVRDGLIVGPFADTDSEDRS